MTLTAVLISLVSTAALRPVNRAHRESPRRVEELGTFRKGEEKVVVVFVCLGKVPMAQSSLDKMLPSAPDQREAVCVRLCMCVCVCVCGCLCL